MGRGGEQVLQDEGRRATGDRGGQDIKLAASRNVQMDQQYSQGDIPHTFGDFFPSGKVDAGSGRLELSFSPLDLTRNKTAYSAPEGHVRVDPLIRFPRRNHLTWLVITDRTRFHGPLILL
jgi:hypothetical protein